MSFQRTGVCKFREIKVYYEEVFIESHETGNAGEMVDRSYKNCSGYCEECGKFECLLDPNSGNGASFPFDSTK